jgi:hypothetical protein
MGKHCLINKNVTQILYYFIILKKEYIYFTSYIGWIYLILLSLFTQMHYTEVRIKNNNLKRIN